MRAMAQPELIIFDCDGVLVDSEPLACRAVSEGLAGLGIALPPEDVMARYTGWSAASMYGDIEQRLGVQVTPGQRDAIGRQVQALLAAHVLPLPGVDEALAELRAACRVCVASSSAPSRIAASLQRAGLGRHFGAHVFSAHEVAHGKPAPDLFLHAAARMGCAPAACLVVEDSVAGAQAARAAGMACLGFTGGGHATPALAEALRAQGVLLVFGHMRELPALVRGLA
jgi:HAD superfamily hydrolase (TIGR01509 family)